MGKDFGIEFDKSPFLKSGDYRVTLFPLFVASGESEESAVELGYAESVADAKSRIAEWKKLKTTDDYFRTTPYDRYIFNKEEESLDVDFGSHSWFINIKRMNHK